MFWYARWPREDVEYIGLDERFFKLLWAVEIKRSKRYFERPSELKSLLSFCVANNPDQAVVTAIDKQGVKECQGIQLTYIPAAVYTYVVGKNTLVQKRMRMG